MSMNVKAPLNLPNGEKIFPLGDIPPQLGEPEGALVENIGVEPMTSCVQGRRSSQLS